MTTTEARPRRHAPHRTDPAGCRSVPAPEFTFSIKSIPFDENYIPADATRITTNFANLARGENRQTNLRKALKMIDNRFNALAHWDNPTADRYSVDLDIISVEMSVAGEGGAESFPLIEILKTGIVDRKTGEHQRDCREQLLVLCARL